MLSTLLLIDAVNKGGPGSGPHTSSSSSGKLPESVTGSGAYGGSSISRLSVPELKAMAIRLGVNHADYLHEKTGPGGTRTGRNKLERALMHVWQQRRASR